MENLIIDPVTTGMLVTFVVQAAKALPVKYVEKIFAVGAPEEQRKARSRMIVFVPVLVATLFQAYGDGMFHVEQIDSIVSMLGVSMVTAYGVYESVVKLVAHLFPEGTFKV